ncbi:hypothetical protein CRM22_007302 [Opisthorchis felineus]|uniref:Cell morphogenesis protein N-terminal domain-containing protein n=1 Tax=Opisthorchis felineus TaxID=147828 RepID=A0A4S2LIS0_OPIFE|nr:hypothetical protein CRM22_007302 [Opisthorchis felineus]
MSTFKPGELAVCTLLRQFTALAKCKIEQALEEKQEHNLMKSMRLSEDIAFDQLLDAFYVSAEFALPSLLSTVIQWYQSQHSSGPQYAAHRRSAQLSNGTPKSTEAEMASMTNSCFVVASSDRDSQLAFSMGKPEQTIKSACDARVGVLKSICMNPTEVRILAERRDLAIDIIFCQVLLSILRQLPYHPGHNDQVEVILEQSFRRFNYRQDIQPQNSENVNLVADMYAEIVGLLSQTRFALVRTRFMWHLNELRSKENSPNVRPSIVSLIMGMKFFRVKMHPIEDFVNFFTFLQELGQYFLEVKEPEIKHVLSDLFVEILLPVAAVARQEVNIPALKQFVELLYPTSLELAGKKKHVPALFPLVTCLLCVGTKSFFLTHWTNFLTICLSQLKSRTPKVALVSLQSLSCLVWVYIVRIGGEKHLETQTKLHHIVNSLFPKNQKFVVPKDAPVNIFVRIIQFIAHEKLEFAIREIIIDRLGVNGLQKNLYMPERMNIGLCAFLLIAHGLQQKEGAPPMPQPCLGAGGFRQAVIKRSFHGTNLNETLGHRLGIQNYLLPIRRAFELILRQLDTQVCRTMMLSKLDVSQKEFEELMSAERKPKMDLLKTCVACIPRLLPNDMTKPELLELLAKVCLHLDEDVRNMAQQAMANLIVELPAFRVKTIQVFIQFIQKNVPDTSPHQLDSSLKTLFHLLNNWNLALQKDGAVSPNITEKAALHETEGFALVMLCHCRTITRRLALHILRKCRSLLSLINAATCDPNARQPREEVCCIDVLDQSVPAILDRVLPLIPLHERHLFSNTNGLDFSVFAERSSPVWLSGPSPVPPCPPVVIPTSFVSPQHSGLMPISNLSSTTTRDSSATERDDQKHTSEALTRNSVCGQCSMFTDGSHPGALGVTGRQQDEQLQPQQCTYKASSNPEQSCTLPGDQTTAAAHVARRPSQRQPQQYSSAQYTQAYIIQPFQERILLGDVWGTCLSCACSPERLLTCSPQAIRYAWNVLFQRLSTLFPLIDPSAQIAENRASSLLRSSSKKPTNEREQLFPLWHNYAVLGCCIAPSSTGLRVSKPRDNRYDSSVDFTPPRATPQFTASASQPSNSICESPEPRFSSAQSNSGIPASQVGTPLRPTSTNSLDTKFTSPTVTRETARDLVRLLVPLLRCEQPEIRDSTVGALGRISPAAFKDALEELNPLLKESVDRKQENVRRRKRRDGLRASLIRVLALMSQNGVFAYPESNALTPQGCLVSQLTDYLDGMRTYLDSVADQAINPTAGACVVSGSGSMVIPATTTGSVSTGSLLVPAVVGGTASTVCTPYSAPTAPLAPVTSNTSLASLASTESHVLVEIRLHFSIFILEVIRQLPKDKRAQLLPNVMRHQLFILISHWSGYHDHVLGVHSELGSSDVSVFGTAGTALSKQGPSTTSSLGMSPVSSGPFTGPDSSVPVCFSVDPSQSNLDPAMHTALTTQASSANLLPTGESAAGVASGCRAHSGSQHNITSQGYSSSNTITATDQMIRRSAAATQDIWEQRLWIDLLWFANQAMAALICSGPIYDHQALFGELTDLYGEHSATGEKTMAPHPGYILRWVSRLLLARDPILDSSPWLWHCPVVDTSFGYSALMSTRSSSCSASAIQTRTTLVGGELRLDALLRQLGEETLVLLLDRNQNLPFLLSWVVDQCYTSNNISSSTACFLCLCRALSNIPDFSCDFVSLLVLAFVFLDHPQKTLSDRAFHLLRVLYHRFILQPGSVIHERYHSPCDQDLDLSASSRSTCSSTVCAQLKINVHFWHSIRHWAPSEIVRQFAAQHPDLTLTIFSEITRRLETCRECLRSALLRLLVPWIINIELVDLIGDTSVTKLDKVGEELCWETLELDPVNSRKPGDGVFQQIAHHADMIDAVEGDSASSDADIVSDEELLPESTRKKSHLIGRRPTDGRPGTYGRGRQHVDFFGSEEDSDNVSADLLKSRHTIPPSTLRHRVRKADTVPLPKSNRARRTPDIAQKSTAGPSGACEEFWYSVPPTLRSTGWGSKQTTELVLNNLFYLTLRFAECPTTTESLKHLWIVLIRHRPSNLRALLRYIIVLTSVAPATLLAHAKRLITYLASEQAESVVDELIVEIQTIDGIGLVVERTTVFPFFRISVAASSVGRPNETTDVRRPADSAVTVMANQTLVKSGSNTSPADGRQHPTDQISTFPPTVLQSMSREFVDQMDAELVAINLESTCGAKPTSTIRDERVFDPSTKPYTESNYCMSSQASGQPPESTAGRGTHEMSMDLPDPSLAFPTQIAGNRPHSPNLLHESDGITSVRPEALEKDMNQDSPKARFSPEDIYATLRAKDVARVLSGSNAGESDGGSEPDRTPFRTEAQLRSGTLPRTEDSRERYFNQAGQSRQKITLGQADSATRTFVRHSKRVKSKSKSHMRPADLVGGTPKVPHQTVSLPPSLAGLAPLPIPLPSAIPSLPSLKLFSSIGAEKQNPNDSGLSSSAAIGKLSRAESQKAEFTLDATAIEKQALHVQPLAMPLSGGYQAPLGCWLCEPLVVGGSVVFTGSWPVAGARAPLVLLLAGGLTHCQMVQVDWSPHIPLMILCALLGMDHCRALVQEECKLLLVSLLNLVCPDQDTLRLLRMELEGGMLARAYPSALPGPRRPRFRLTLDGGPYAETFGCLSSPVPMAEDIPQTSFQPRYSPTEGARATPPRKSNRRSFSERLSLSPPNPTIQVSVGEPDGLPSHSPPIITSVPPSSTLLVQKNGWSGSAYSLLSTDTLIPGPEESGARTRPDGFVITKDAPQLCPSASAAPVSSVKSRLTTARTTPPRTSRHSIGSSQVMMSTVVEEADSPVVTTDAKLLQAAVYDLREVLLSTLGQAVWTWDEYRFQRAHTSPVVYLTQQHHSRTTECDTDITSEFSDKRSLLARLVQLVARILALANTEPSDAESCLLCHHGPPHEHAFAHRLKHSSDCRTATSPVTNYCVVARLSQISLNMGLSCPNRHYASRCLQIFRILGAHLDRKTLSHLLSRLGETVSDANEELQDYVAELFLTLEAAIAHVKTKSNSLLVGRTSKQGDSVSGPWPDKQTRTAPTSPRSVGGHVPNVDLTISDRRRSQRHSTSTNYCILDGPSSWFKPQYTDEPKQESETLLVTHESSRLNHILGSEESASRPRTPRLVVCRLPKDEQVDLVCGIFWTGVFLLESDFEHEYIAGLRILTTLVPSVCADAVAEDNERFSSRALSAVPICLPTRAEQIRTQLHLSSPVAGVLNLAIKGCSSASLVDPACQLLVCLIPFLNSPLVVSPSKSHLTSQLSFPIVLITLLPMLLTAWDEDPATAGPSGLLETTVEQTNVLQGGFLGRGVCTNTNATPRALGSWVSSATTRSATVATHISHSSRLGRPDSFSHFPATGGFGTISAVTPGPYCPSTSSTCIHKSLQPVPLRPKNPICIQAADALAQRALQLDPSHLANLALILRLYASGTFSKDVDQWAKCVVCYLLEGYPKYAAYLLQHISTLLTAGPLCLKTPLLKIAYLFLQQVELTSPELSNTVQHFISSITSHFLGTEFWSEVTRVIQIVVSRSAVLSAAPPPCVYKLSGLDPSGSGRVLDFAAAAAAVAVPLPESEPLRMELAGPVLDFTFNTLYEAPLVAAHFAPATFSATTEEICKSSGVHGVDIGSSKKTDFFRLSDSGLTDLFSVAASSWNKAGSRQLRLRDRLFRLVACYGLPSNRRFAAPRSPSVIFSQSTETLDPQLSVHSSSETASMVDMSNSDDIRLDETSSMEQAAVFRDLDTFLDAQLMNINFLGVPDGRLASASASASEDEPRRPWGVRGQSITCHQEFSDDGVEQAADMFPTVRAPLSKSFTQHSSDEPLPWTNKRRSFPASYSTEVQVAPGSDEPDWVPHAPCYTSSGEPWQHALASSTVDAEGIPTQHPPLRNAQVDAYATVRCVTEDNNLILPSFPNNGDQPGVEIVTNTHLATVKRLSFERIVEPSTPSLIRTPSRDDDAFILDQPASPVDKIDLTRIRQVRFERTSKPLSPTLSHHSVLSDPIKTYTSLAVLDTNLSQPKMGSSASLPQMLISELKQPSKSAGCEISSPFEPICHSGAQDISSTLSVHAELSSSPSQTSLTQDTPVSSRTNHELDTPHRSLSTSILLTPNDYAAENVLKLAYSRPKPLRSPIKRLYATGLPSRISAPPLVKIHKAFTIKRHSQSAEDLPQLAQPKVSFLIPGEADEQPSETSQLLSHSHSLKDLPVTLSSDAIIKSQFAEDGSSESNIHTGLNYYNQPPAMQQIVSRDQPSGSSCSIASITDKVILVSDAPPGHSWIELLDGEKDWITMASGPLAIPPVPAQIDVINRLSSVCGCLASRCYACVVTASNLSGSTWEDEQNEFRKFISAAELIVNGLRPPYFFSRLSQDSLDEHLRSILDSVSVRLADTYNGVQSMLHRMSKVLCAQNLQATLEMLAQLLERMVEFLKLACTTTQQLPSALEQSIPSQGDLLERIVFFVSRVVPHLVESPILYPVPPAINAHGCVEDDNCIILKRMDEYFDCVNVKTVDTIASELFGSLVALYRRRWKYFGTRRILAPVVDCAIGILDLYVRYKLRTLDVPGPTVIHVTLPAMGSPNDGDSSVLTACTRLLQRLSSDIN